MNGNNQHSENGSIEYEQGRIEFWNATGGYGFVAVDGRDEDAFFHIEDIDVDEERLAEEVDVEVIVEEAEKGPRVEAMRFPATDGGRDDFDDRLMVSQISEEDGVYRVENRSHDDPSEHTYKVFCDGGDSYHCECPAWEYHDDKCKHMLAVEAKLESRKDWTDWQEYQKQHREELFEAHQGEEAVEQEDVDEGIEAAKKCVEVHEEMKEDAEWESLEEWRELTEQATEAILNADEWREMSSDGRARYVAFL